MASTQVASASAVACFAAGTLIATATGSVAVEDLTVGDTVMTMAGSTRPVVWIGSRAVDCARHPRPGDGMADPNYEREHLARMCRGAICFCPSIHAVYIDGVLVPVRLLTNGTSIIQVKRCQRHVLFTMSNCRNMRSSWPRA